MLSHSRKGYSEAVYRQTTESFIRCLENAFWHFGGVPRRLVLDNLKAAVKQADWFDPELNPKVQSFCAALRHGLLPTKPYTPRHKGKVERGVDYVQENALKGRTVRQPGGAEPATCCDWEADGRRHAHPRHDPQAGAASCSRRWRSRRCCRCRPSGSPSSTRPSGRCIATATSRWRRPITRCRRSTWAGGSGCAGTAGWCGSSTSRMEQIAVHVRHEPGRFSTQTAAHRRPRRSAASNAGAAWLFRAESPHRPAGTALGRGHAAGPRHRGRARAARAARAWPTRTPHDATRTRLRRSPCRTAAYRLRTVRQLIDRDWTPTQQELLRLQRRASASSARCPTTAGSCIERSYPNERRPRMNDTLDNGPEATAPVGPAAAAWTCGCRRPPATA